MSSSSAGSASSAIAGTTQNPNSRRDPNADHRSIPISVDLVAAARRHLSFLHSISISPFPSLLRSLRRYEDLWMPLISHLSRPFSSSSPNLLPPLDVLWIWHCHRLSPRSYRDYCLSRFDTLIEMPAVFDEENEEYASDRCREIWISRYPSDPFDLDDDEEEDEYSNKSGASSGDLLRLVEKHRELPSYLSDPFLSETVYLVSARDRYRSFLRLVRRSPGTRLASSADIALMWMMHKSFPGVYWRDAEAMGMEDLEERIAGFGDSAEEEETRRIWEEVYDEPYERAGGVFRPSESPSREFVFRESPESDVNRVYTMLKPRFHLEVHVHLEGKCGEGKESKDEKKNMFLRLRTMRCHREMKLEIPVSTASCGSWRRVWRVCFEYGTQGIFLVLRQHGSGCVGGGKVVERLVFQWKDLLRERSLSLCKEFGDTLRAVVSITAPIQVPYLLKCVPDRVTDDGGAMISDVILRMNGYHMQKGRWLTRTVLDHGSRECFVIRTRVAEGFWRKRAENPKAVKWEDRIIEVRHGPWSYVASSVGRSLGKVVGTATPKVEDRVCKKMIWSLSTGHLLTVQYEGHLTYHLQNADKDDSVRLLRGRKLEYQVKSTSPNSRDFEEEEEHYVTVIRVTPENPEGKAIALLNWRLFAVEFPPEGDAVFILLLCTAIVRSISEITRRDVGQLLLRRRVKDTKAGLRDWGSVMLPSSHPHLQPWFWNADKVLSPCAEMNDIRQPSSWYYASDGKDELYRQVILPS